MSDRRAYPILITINGRPIHKVVIDPHYEIKHLDSINDQIILDLVRLLDGKTFLPEEVDDDFQYFKTEPLVLRGLSYRLVWLLEGDEMSRFFVSRTFDATI